MSAQAQTVTAPTDLEVSAWPALSQSSGFTIIEDVTVEGNRLIPTQDILNLVKTKRGDRFDREQVLQDLKAVNSMGYFNDHNLQVVPEKRNGGAVVLKIRVQENAPVTQFCFHGNEVISTDEMSRVFSDQLGKPQNLNQLSSSVEKLEQTYRDRGYVLARVTDVKDDPDGTISLTINEGIIDDIQIIGNKKTKDFVIRRTIKLKPGSIYNEKQLTQDLRRLYANGYFQDIRRSLVPSANDPEKFTLKVDVAEKRTGSVGLGGGVDTVAGPFGTLSFSDNNFRGRGEVLSFNSAMGTGMYNNLANTVNNGGTQFLSNKPTYNVQATFIEPNVAGSNTGMAVSGYGRTASSMMVQQAMQQTLGGSVTLVRPLTNNLTANVGLSGEQISLTDLGSLNGQNAISYLTERALAMGTATTTAGAKAVATSIRNQQLKAGAYVTVSPTLSYDTRDNPQDATRGTAARLTAGPSFGLTGASFVKLGASVSQYIPITRETTLAMNVTSGQSFGGLPQFGMYNLGGLSGIRGYRQFSDLGTGTSMLMASAEIRRRLPIPLLDPSNKLAGVVNPIVKNMKGVLFADIGQVGGNGLINGYFQRSAMGASVGFALRINMPMVGPVSLNYGFPLLSSVLGKMTPRFTVGFGNRF